MEYKPKRISVWRGRGRSSRLRRDNRPAISGYPTAHERHGREQRSAIALKLIFGYLNCRPSNIVVKYSTEGGDSLLGTKGGDCWKDPRFRTLNPWWHLWNIIWTYLLKWKFLIFSTVLLPLMIFRTIFKSSILI